MFPTKSPIKANATGMKMEGPKKQPMDPRLEVAQELKQHMLGLALTHRKLKASIEASKKKPKKPAADDESAMDDGDEAGEAPEGC